MISMATVASMASSQTKIFIGRPLQEFKDAYELFGTLVCDKYLEQRMWRYLHVT